MVRALIARTVLTDLTAIIIMMPILRYFHWVTLGFNELLAVKLHLRMRL